MPGANLTRIEAEERKSIIAAPIHYTVKLDLTRGAKDFGSETTITFDAKPGESSFLDLIANEVSEITLNGETLDPAEAYVDSRIELKNLKEHNEVTVKAMCQYSNTGEGPAPQRRPVRRQRLPVYPVRSAGRPPCLRRVRPA